MLPEPADSKHMYRDFIDLPPGLNKMIERPNLKRKLTPYVGKWPDFPLELHDELRMGKFGPAPGPPLGPARVSDFKEPVRTFWEKELSGKLTQQERGMLKMLENRWPEYPREFIRLAQKPRSEHSGSDAARFAANVGRDLRHRRALPLQRTTVTATVTTSNDPRPIRRYRSSPQVRAARAAE